MSGHKQCRKCVEYYRTRAQRQEYRNQRRARRQTQEYKVWRRAYLSKPAVQERNRARRRTPKMRAYMREYMKKPSMRAYFRTSKMRASRRTWKHNRQSRLLGNGGAGWTPAQFAALCKKHGDHCVCCGRKRKLQPDHILPVAKGGRNEISNIQPLCGPCNQSKNGKTGPYTCRCGRHNPCASRRLKRRLKGC